jgi:hypothetical protein
MSLNPAPFAWTPRCKRFLLSKRGKTTSCIRKKITNAVPPIPIKYFSLFASFMRDENLPYGTMPVVVALSAVY